MSDMYETTEIPEEFWSAYSEQPFEICVECDAPLTQGQTPYAVQKHFVAGEAVFEMAICIRCASRLQESFSAESKQALVAAIHDAPERRLRQQEAEALVHQDSHDLGPDPDVSDPETCKVLERIFARDLVRKERAMSSCGLCGKPRTDCHRYSLGTACLGMMMVAAPPDADNLGSPFLICEDCELKLNECLSQKTRDAWNRFVEDNFDGPPALAVDPRELVAMF